jgi:hypothetical protein
MEFDDSKARTTFFKEVHTFVILQNLYIAIIWNVDI